MPIVQNFGFMWERQEVNWGRRGKGGSAQFDGVKVGNKKRVVSFLDQMGIYVLYDRFEQPVQVGQAKNIFACLGQHRKDHLRNRWSYFTWFGFYKISVGHELLKKDQATELKKLISLGESLDEIEAVLIQVMEPRLNTRGPNWNEAEEFLQIPKATGDNVAEEIDEEEAEEA